MWGVPDQKEWDNFEHFTGCDGRVVTICGIGFERARWVFQRGAAKEMRNMNITPSNYTLSVVAKLANRCLKFEIRWKEVGEGFFVLLNSGKASGLCIHPTFFVLNDAPVKKTRSYLPRTREAKMAYRISHCIPLHAPFSNLQCASGLAVYFILSPFFHGTCRNLSTGGPAVPTSRGPWLPCLPHLWLYLTSLAPRKQETQDGLQPCGGAPPLGHAGGMVGWWNGGTVIVACCSSWGVKHGLKLNMHVYNNLIHAATLDADLLKACPWSIESTSRHELWNWMPPEDPGRNH